MYDVTSMCNEAEVEIEDAQVEAVETEDVLAEAVETEDEMTEEVVAEVTEERVKKGEETEVVRRDTK